MKKSLLFLGLAAVGLYLWSQRGGKTYQLPGGLSVQPGAEYDKAISQGAAFGTSLVDLVKKGTSGIGSLPTELRGMDGMAPESLGACMDGVGAMGELGGTFYGSY